MALGQWGTHFYSEKGTTHRGARATGGSRDPGVHTLRPGTGRCAGPKRLTENIGFPLSHLLPPAQQTSNKTNSGIQLGELQRLILQGVQCKEKTPTQGTNRHISAPQPTFQHEASLEDLGALGAKKVAVATTNTCCMILSRDTLLLLTKKETS